MTENAPSSPNAGNVARVLYNGLFSSENPPSVDPATPSLETSYAHPLGNGRGSDFSGLDNRPTTRKPYQPYAEAIAEKNGVLGPSEKLPQTKDALSTLGMEVIAPRIQYILADTIFDRFKENSELKQKLETFKQNNPNPSKEAMAPIILEWYNQTQTLNLAERELVQNDIIPKIGPIIRGNNSFLEVLAKKVQETTSRWKKVPAELEAAIKNPTSPIMTSIGIGAIIHIFSQEGKITEWKPAMIGTGVAFVLSAMPDLIEGNEGFLIGGLIGGKLSGWKSLTGYGLGILAFRPETVGNYVRAVGSLAATATQMLDLGSVGNTQDMALLWNNWIQNDLSRYAKSLVQLGAGEKTNLGLAVQSEVLKDVPLVPAAVRPLMEHLLNVQFGKPGLTGVALEKAIKDAGEFIGQTEGLVTPDEYARITTKRAILSMKITNELPILPEDKLTPDEKKKALLGLALNLQAQVLNPENAFITGEMRQQFEMAVSNGQSSPMGLENIPFKDAKGNDIDFSTLKLNDFTQNPEIQNAILAMQIKAKGMGNEFLQGATRTLSGTLLTAYLFTVMMSWTFIGVSSVVHKIKEKEKTKNEKKVDTPEQKPLTERVHKELKSKLKGEKTAKEIYEILVANKIVQSNNALKTALEANSKKVKLGESANDFKGLTDELANYEVSTEKLRNSFFTCLSAYTGSIALAEAEKVQKYHETKTKLERFFIFVQKSKKKDFANIKIKNVDYKWDQSGFLGRSASKLNPIAWFKQKFTLMPTAGGKPQQLSFSLDEKTMEIKYRLIPANTKEENLVTDGFEMDPIFQVVD